jgi:hypothetical protein
MLEMKCSIQLDCSENCNEMFFRNWRIIIWFCLFLIDEVGFRDFLLIYLLHKIATEHAIEKRYYYIYQKETTENHHNPCETYENTMMFCYFSHEAE